MHDDVFNGWPVAEMERGRDGIAVAVFMDSSSPRSPDGSRPVGVQGQRIRHIVDRRPDEKPPSEPVDDRT
jgi:hypothetical protein